jgi:hypothetical protein
MMAIIQEDENCNTSHRRVVETSDLLFTDASDWRSAGDRM